MHGKSIGKLALSGISAIIGICGSANAAVVAQDLVNPGDGLLTYDSSTGLAWLDATMTQNESYNSIVAGHGGYTTQLGFRYATTEEVGQLFLDAGVVQGNIWGYWNFGNQYYLASQSLMSLLGVTYPHDGLSIYSMGLTGSSTPNAPGTHELAYIGVNSHADSLAFQDAGPVDNAYAVSYIGSYLVRDAAPVPEPGAQLLFGSGLAIFAGSSLFRSGGHRSKPLKIGTSPVGELVRE